MGEYIKYKGNEIKIGTCESLYYTSYHKYAQALQDGQLASVPGNDRLKHTQNRIRVTVLDFLFPTKTNCR